MTVIRLTLWAAILGALALIIYPLQGRSAVLYTADGDGTTVALTDEPCRLQEVSNLKRRATWNEKGEIFEGCWGAHKDTGLILAYFSDKTVVIFPPQIFLPVRGV